MSSDTIIEVGPSAPPMIPIEPLHEISVVQSAVKQVSSAMILIPFLFLPAFKMFSNLFLAVFPLSEKDVESRGGFKPLIILFTSVSFHSF